MEIPKFGISRLVFFSDHNRMILTDVQSDPPAKFRPKPPISERAVLIEWFGPEFTPEFTPEFIR